MIFKLSTLLFKNICISMREVINYITRRYNVKIYDNNILNSENLFINITDELVNFINQCKFSYVIWQNLEEVKKIDLIYNKNVINFCVNKEVHNFLKSKNIENSYIDNTDDFTIYNYRSNFCSKKNISLLISGFTRTFCKTYKSLLEFINNNDEYNFDLYLLIHTKQDNGKNKKIKSNFYRDIRYLDHFNVKFVIYKKYGEIDSANMNYWGQFYFVNYLYNSYCKYIDLNKISYDLIIRSRYDITINNYKIKPVNFYKKKIVVPKRYFWGYSKELNLIKPIIWDNLSNDKINKLVEESYIINDKFAIGTPKLMDKYLSYGSNQREVSDFVLRNYKISSTEGNLAYYLKNNNIDFFIDWSLNCSLCRC